MKKIEMFSILFFLFALAILLLPIQAKADNHTLFDYSTTEEGVTINGPGPAWSEFSGVLTIPATIDGQPVIAIADRAFEDAINPTITGLEFEGTIEEIGWYAFQNALFSPGSHVNIDARIIGSQAFAGLGDDVRITYSENIQELSYGVFSESVVYFSEWILDDSSVFTGQSFRKGTIRVDGNMMVDAGVFNDPLFMDVTIIVKGDLVVNGDVSAAFFMGSRLEAKSILLDTGHIQGAAFARTTIATELIDIQTGFAEGYAFGEITVEGSPEFRFYSEGGVAEFRNLTGSFSSFYLKTDAVLSMFTESVIDVEGDMTFDVSIADYSLDRVSFNIGGSFTVRAEEINSTFLTESAIYAKEGMSIVVENDNDESGRFMNNALQTDGVFSYSAPSAHSYDFGGTSIRADERIEIDVPIIQGSGMQNLTLSSPTIIMFENIEEINLYSFLNMRWESETPIVISSLIKGEGMFNTAHFDTDTIHFTDEAHFVEGATGLFIMATSKEDMNIRFDTSTIPDQAIAHSQINFDQVLIGDNVRSIEYMAFGNTTYRTDKFIIPETVDYMAPQVFAAARFNNAEISLNARSVDVVPFVGSSGIDKVTIGENVSTMTSPMAPGTSIRQLEVGSGLQTIPSGLFSDMNLEVLVIAEGVTHIGDRAFAGNDQFGRELSQLTLPSTIRTIGDFAFDTPMSVKTIDLQHATQIGRHVFGDNDTMERLIIRAGDAMINSHAYFPERYGRNGTATEDPKDFVVMGCYGSMVEEFADIRGYSFATIADCKSYYVDGYNPPDDAFRPGTPVITHTGTNPSPVPVDVTVTYASEDTLNQFRVNYGKWTTYTGTFTIYGDVFIQARSIADDGWVSNYGQLDLNWMQVPGANPDYPLLPPGDTPPADMEPTPYPDNTDLPGGPSQPGDGTDPTDPTDPGDGGTDPTDPEGPACTFDDISRYVYVAELMKRDPHVTNAIQKVAEMDDSCVDKQALEDRMAVVIEWIAERDYQLFKDIVHRNLKWAESFEREPYLTALDASEDLREEDQPEVDAAKQAIYDAMTQKQIDAAVKAANTQVGYAERYKRDPYLTRAADAIDKVPYGPERDALQVRLDAVVDAVSASLEAGKVTAATAAVEKAEGGSSIFWIDDAQALVTALKDSDEKAALQERLDAIELTDAMLFAYELKNDIAALEVEAERTLFDASFESTKVYAERVTSSNLAKAEAAFAALAPYELSHTDLYERLAQYLADVKAKIAEDAMYARAESVIALAERYKRQTYIDKAQAEIDLLPEGERRDALQARLDGIEQ